MLFDNIISTRVKKSRTLGAPRWVSAAKSVSWRIVGTIDTLVISFLVTGQLDLALAIGGVELVTKMILYYVHERVWDKINTRLK